MKLKLKTDSRGIDVKDIMIMRFGGGKHVNISYRRSPHLAFNNMIKFFNSSRQSHKPQEIMALFLSLVDKVIWVRHHKSSLEVNRNKGEKKQRVTSR